MIYTIVLLKLCFLRLSKDRNHAVSLADFLNIQKRHLQLLSDPRKLLCSNDLGVLLTTHHYLIRQANGFQVPQNVKPWLGFGPGLTKFLPEKPPKEITCQIASDD